MKYLVAILLVLLAGSLGMYQASVYGDSIDWTSVELSKKESEFTNEMDNSFGLCKQANSVDIVSDLEYMDGATLSYKGCIIEGQDVDMYVSPLMDISSGHPRNFAIRTKPNGKFYFMKPGTITNMQHAQLIPGTNIYTEWRYTPYDSTLVRAMDIREALVADRFDSMGNPIRYAFDESSISVKTRSFVNDSGPYLSGAFTRDGKFLFWSMNGLLYKINLATGVRDVKYMPGPDINWQNVPYYSHQIFPVDSEGRYVFLGGKLDMLVDTADCGQYYVEIDFMGIPEQVMAEQTNCKMKSFKGLVNTEESPANNVFGAKFEGNKLQIGAYRNGSKSLVEFLPEGLSDERPASLDYLALGDSYSSGEGDIGRQSDGSSYYLIGTDSPKDNCHISSRSYPYLLRNMWNISADNMRSVACSGARGVRDYWGYDQEYFGQDDRLIGLDDISERQAAALQGFQPGYLPQIDFIKEYKPKVITLTGGGNDVGFARILSYCVSPQASDFIPFTDTTCEYAKEGSGLNKMLRRAIDAQYKPLKEFVDEVAVLSPNTQVIMVGYPSLIAEYNGIACMANSGVMNLDEMRMINNATKQLNEVIKKVAQDTHTSYVDTYASLNGGRICEGSEYMTDLLAWAAGLAGQEETFHPNAAGHKKLAEAISASGVYSQPVVPVSNYIVEHTTTQQMSLYASDTPIYKYGDEIPITTKPGTLLPGSTYQMTGRSDPVNLGMFTVLPDGSASARVTFANVPIGKHTLVLEGTAADGTPATYYQFVEVRYSQDDADGDGIMDTDDKCNFVRYWYDETMGKDVCSTSDADSKAENATPDMAVGNTLLNRSEKNTDLLTLDVTSPQYLSKQSSNIVGVPDSLQPLAHKIDSSTLVSRERHNGLTLPLIALIIITVIIGCIWRKRIKHNS